MLCWLRLLAKMAAVLGVMIASPAAALQSLPVVDVIAGTDGPPLSSAIRYTKALGPLDVPIAQIDKLPLLANPAGVQHFGPPGERTALALRIRNVGTQAGTWILTTGRGSLSHFRLYEFADGKFQLLIDGDDPAAAQANLRTYQAFSSEITLDPGQTRTVIIDFLSDNSTYMPLRLETYGTFFQDRRANIAMVAGVVLGIAVLTFLNFVFFSVTGHREFGWLALAQTLFAISTVHAEGYLTIFLLADSPVLSVALEDAIKCAFAASMAQFARTFLNTPARFPRLDKALRGLIIVGVAVILLQSGLAFFGPDFRAALHALSWVVAGVVALFLPWVGIFAIRHVGRQLWPLLVGWASLALFIIYGAIASMGVFQWLPINWHWVGPVGLFEVLMVTLALGLNLRKIQADRQEADAKYAQSMAERLRISEQAARLAEEREAALMAVDNQNALLHASGHDSRQVILALNSAISVLKRSDADGVHRDLTQMLESSAKYLSEIAATTMSGATMIGSQNRFVALSAFKGDALIEPLMMMFKGPFASKGLTIEADIDRTATMISDRPLLMRALANLLSNSLQHTAAGGARVTLRTEGNNAVITLADTGSGMPQAIAEQLMRGDLPRLRTGNGAVKGSGFRSAKQIIESLGGTLTIEGSDPTGTDLEIRLCCAFQTITPCALEALAAQLPGWKLADFDRRNEFQTIAADLGRARTDHLIAATYDDTSVTRGRISETAAMMLIKPLALEMAQHPALRAVSYQL